MTGVVYENLPPSVELREVGPREGFQSEKMILPTEKKMEIINAIMDTGIKYIQVGSLVHPKAVPQHADCEAVFAGIRHPDDITLSVLVPNLKGAERALKLGANDWNFMLSVSDSHSKANSNATTFEAMDRMPAMLELAKEAGAQVNGGMGTALGCPFEGKIPLERLYKVVERYLDMGINSIGVADTAGMADPALVYSTMKALTGKYPEVHFKMHIHNTRGLGVANILAAMQAGVQSFDSSIGGLGGCPFAPGASGNVATEDLAHMFQLMGVETGVDVDRVLQVSAMLAEVFGHPCDSAVSRAGTSWELHDLVAARKAEISVK